MSNALKPPPQEFPPFNRDPALAIEQAITALKTIVERHPEVTQDFDCEAFVHHELAPALNALRSETQTRLAEAAPDLLAALERIVQLNEQMPADHPSRLSHGEEKQAVAAINKARGL